MSDTNDRYACVICGKSFPIRELFPCGAIRDSIANRILGDRSTWAPDDFICKQCMTKLGADYVHFLLDSEKGELTNIDGPVKSPFRGIL
jgi:hypothetical protein